ncbi:MAG: hypothetical protein HZB13_07280, partial [Acidobacteria bacterium]|nr:hypothetical protein [Acidobacteriota bacterium]
MLTSWKEIAGFLNVSPRTAQLYEKTRGLPVVRMGTRPAIRESELRAWQAAGLQYPSWWERVPVLQAWALTATVLLLVASAGWWWMWRTTRGFGDPVDARWSGSVLTAYDVKGR